MADRDPVEAAADALMEAHVLSVVPDTNGQHHVIDYIPMRDAIATALRTEANRAGEAMRGHAVHALQNFARSVDGEPDAEGWINMAADLVASLEVPLPLSGAPASPWPKVKALVWGDTHAERGIHMQASAPFGRYILIRGTGFHFKVQGPGGFKVAHKSEAKAKAAAQADYERRILSALDIRTPPAKDETA